MNELISHKEVDTHRIYLKAGPGFFPGITHIGQLDFSSAEPPLPRHIHSSAMEMCYVEKGSPVFTAGPETFRLRSGQCFICPSNLSHGTGSFPLDKMRMYWIGYNPRLLADEIYQRGPDEEKARFLSSVKWDKPVIFQGNREMGRLIGELVDLAMTDVPFRYLRTRENTLRLFHLIGFSKKSRSSESTEILEVCRYIKEHYKERIRVEDLAGKINLSESHFKARFREETGFPPGEYIQRVRVEEAQKLLIARQSVTEVAFTLGFSSSQYFATVFKRFTGRSPRSWLNASHPLVSDYRMPDSL